MTNSEVRWISSGSILSERSTRSASRSDVGKIGGGSLGQSSAGRHIRPEVVALIDDLSAHQGHQHVHRFDALGRYGHDVVRQNDQIRELARFNGTLDRFFEGRVGVVDGFQPERLLSCDFLVRAKYLPADGVARNEMVERPKRWVWHYRCVGAGGDHESMVKVGS